MPLPGPTDVPAAPDDAGLMRAAQKGDRAAFSALVRAHQRSVFFTALRVARGDEQLARDVAQRTFLQAWRKREEFRGEAAVRTWLLRIATNLCLNELRRSFRSRELSPAGEDGAPRPLGRVEAAAFDRLADREARALLRAAVEGLPPRQRAVAVLRIYEELSFAEIGEAVGITANNAKVNFHHACRTIRRRLADQGVAA